MLKSKSEYMQIIIPKKAILDEMQVYITCVEDTIFIGKNLNAILCRCDIFQWCSSVTKSGGGAQFFSNLYREKWKTKWNKAI